MPKVSVIIPSYNREKHVVKAIDSVLGQTYRDFELIVVDDGSADNTRSALEAYGERIHPLFQPNAGVSAARNSGIKAARGQWLAFLDSDDEWAPDYLARQIGRAGQVPGLCMQTANCVVAGLDGKTQSYFELSGVLAELKHQDYLLVRDPFRFVIKHGPWQIGSTIVLSEAIGKAGLFDTSLRISEDLDLMARVAIRGPFGVIREPLVNIYRRDEPIECLTQHARNHPLQARESDERLYQKLARIEGLKPAHRKALHALMAANRRAMGNLLLAGGKPVEARDYYKRALSMDHSMRSLGKYVLSLPRAMSKGQIPPLDSSTARGGKAG